MLYIDGMAFDSDKMKDAALMLKLAQGIEELFQKNNPPTMIAVSALAVELAVILEAAAQRHPDGKAMLNAFLEKITNDIKSAIERPGNWEGRPKVPSKEFVDAISEELNKPDGHSTS